MKPGMEQLLNGLIVLKMLLYNVSIFV